MRRGVAERSGVVALLVALLFAPVTASAADLADGVTWENGVVTIGPCDLTFSIASERWVAAPTEVFVPTGNFRGFMLGRKGVVDSRGQEVIPTISVLWEPITYVLADQAHGNVDPLDAYARDRRADGGSKEFKVVRTFSSRDGSIRLKRASGLEFAATLNGRPSKVLAVYAIDERHKVGIQIAVEVPSEVWPRLHGELEAILASFEGAPTKAPAVSSPSPPSGAASRADDSCRGAAAAGCAALALRLATGDGAPEDGPRAIELFGRACDGGDAGGCFNLGLSYDKGRFVPENRGRALSLYRRACDGGNPSGCINLAWFYENGVGVTKSGATAAGLYGKGCDLGNATGCSNLGYLYLNGDGVVQGPKKAVELFAKSCEGGEALGCKRLGDCYRDGVGVGADPVKATAYFKRSCDGRDASGCAELGTRYMNGLGTAVDFPKAVELARKGCDGGAAAGCTALGLLFVGGQGVGADRAKAKVLFERACDAKDALGCAALGHVYDDAHDSIRAAEYFRKGCDLGSKFACTSLHSN